MALRCAPTSLCVQHQSQDSAADHVFHLFSSRMPHCGAVGYSCTLPLEFSMQINVTVGNFGDGATVVTAKRDMLWSFNAGMEHFGTAQCHGHLLEQAVRDIAAGGSALGRGRIFIQPSTAPPAAAAAAVAATLLLLVIILIIMRLKVCQQQIVCLKACP
jgi:hypothetical protein